jgi:hypothetical protein
MSTKLIWNLSWIGEVVLTLPDERVPAYAEALDELGFGDARMVKVEE